MSDVVRDDISDVEQMPRQFYFVTTHPDSNHKIDRIDIIMMILLWAVSAWSIVAERLCDEKNEYVSDRAKFWIGITIPICTSATALLETVQVGMEYHDKNQHANGIHELREGGIDVHLSSNPNQEEVETVRALVTTLNSIHSQPKRIKTNPSRLAHSSTASATADTNFLFNGKVDASASETSTNSEETDKDELEAFNNKYLEGQGV